MNDGTFVIVREQNNSVRYEVIWFASASRAAKYTNALKAAGVKAGVYRMTQKMTIDKAIMLFRAFFR